jgi:hypothetical protein
MSLKRTFLEGKVDTGCFSHTTNSFILLILYLLPGLEAGTVPEGAPL